MKQLLQTAVITALLTVATSAQAIIIGDVTGGGTFSDNVSSDNGWITETAAGNGVDFWTFSAAAGSVVSISISASIDFGISLYEGIVDDDAGFAFDNDGDFNGGIYIGGTNGFFSDGGSSLDNLSLLSGGIYTIAVGGDSGFGGFDAPYEYTMNVASVPEPVTAWLLVPAMLGLFELRRRQKQ